MKNIFGNTNTIKLIDENGILRYWYTSHPATGCEMVFDEQGKLYTYRDINIHNQKNDQL